MIKPINQRIILEPNISKMRGTLFVPDQYVDGATTCMVVAAGEKVNSFIKEGSIVMCQVGFAGRNSNIEGTKAFWAEENNIYAVLRGGLIFPLGQRVLIRRDIEESEVGGIVIPANRRYQSLTGTIVRLGFSKIPMRIADLKTGDKIRLTEWQEHYQQITLEDGSHGLICNDKDLLCKYED